MAALSRVQTLLRALSGKTGAQSLMQHQSSSPWQLKNLRCCSKMSSPSLCVYPKTSLCDEVVSIKASGLLPGQQVTLRAEVYTENGKYKFESKANYKADGEGKVRVIKDPSLGGSYTGIEPMGLFLFLEPVPEVAKKFPRFVKWDVTKPYIFTLQLIDEGEGQEKVISSTTMEKRFLVDYVERIPMTMGEAEGVLFLPKQRGSSDPLPFVIDIRGLLTNLVVDRAATLASHGFAVFAFDYFMPRRMKNKELNTYIDAQAFLDIIDFAKEHPRLDENRIGMTSSCYGGAMMLNAATRLNLPVKCMVAAGFVDVLSVTVGWKNLDGSLVEPVPIERYLRTWTDDQGKSWITFNKKNREDDSLKAEEWVQEIQESDQLCKVENINCPLLLFCHQDDLHIMSVFATNYLKERMEKAGKSHLLDFVELPGTGHFLEVPFQPINTISSLYDPTTIQSKPTFHYTNYGGDDKKQGVKDQQFAWGKIVNFFRKHLDVKEMYRTDWVK